jgi:hypothetical protein
MNIAISDLRTDRQWRAATGYDQVRFQKLLVHFKAAYKNLFGCQMPDRDIVNPVGVTFVHEEELLFYTLFSLKSGLTYDLLALVIGCDRSNAKRNQELGIRILTKALADAGHAPKRSFESVDEFEAYFTKNSTLILDGTEQRTQRPKGKQAQKEAYSGKKNVTR